MILVKLINFLKSVNQLREYYIQGKRLFDAKKKENIFVVKQNCLIFVAKQNCLRALFFKKINEIITV